MVPKTTPDKVVTRLSEGFEKLVKDEGFLRLMGKINSRVDFLGYKEFDKLLKKEQSDLKALYEFTEIKAVQSCIKRRPPAMFGGLHSGGQG